MTPQNTYQITDITCVLQHLKWVYKWCLLTVIPRWEVETLFLRHVNVETQTLSHGFKISVCMLLFLNSGTTKTLLHFFGLTETQIAILHSKSSGVCWVCIISKLHANAYHRIMRDRTLLHVGLVKASSWNPIIIISSAIVVRHNYFPSCYKSDAATTSSGIQTARH